MCVFIDPICKNWTQKRHKKQKANSVCQILVRMLICHHCLKRRENKLYSDFKNQIWLPLFSSRYKLPRTFFAPILSQLAIFCGNCDTIMNENQQLAGEIRNIYDANSHVPSLYLGDNLLIYFKWLPSVRFKRQVLPKNHSIISIRANLCSPECESKLDLVQCWSP